MRLEDRRPSLFALLFGFDAVVDRRTYLLAGSLLFALKFLLEAGLTKAFEDRVPTLAEFFTPFAAQHLSSSPVYALLFGCLSLPFLWIGVSMSVRRAVNAGRDPWVGTLFVVPGLNYFILALLAILPPKPKTTWHEPIGAGPFRSSTVEHSADRPADVQPSIRAAMLGVAAAAGVGVTVVVFTAFVSKSYGVALFFLTPFAMGAVSGWASNRRDVISNGATIGISLASLLMAGCAMLLFALEGLMCVIMALPIAALAVAFGAVVGRQIAMRSIPRVSAALAFVIPGMGFLEGYVTPPLVEVRSAVEVAAPPEVVWQHVIAFPELPPPDGMLFRAGIAYPMRAHIDGTGIGAVRYCEFSTGPFVEPITRWDVPKTLSFDVRSQPPAMTEWSPYRMIHPAHLDASIRSQRGEFRLVPLPNGHTRLEGSTWYTLAVAPFAYWRLWSDGAIHRIHMRVLEHVKTLSEGAPGD